MDDRRRGATLVVGALGVLVLAALGAGSQWGRIVTIRPETPQPPPVEPLASPTWSPSFPPHPLGDLPEVEPARLPDWVAELAGALVVAAGLALAAWLVVVLVKAFRAPGLRLAGAGTGSAVEIPEIDEEEVALSLAQTLARLRSGVAVGDAVVECWRRLEAIAAETGVAREPTQTSEEFTVAILAHTVVDDDALGDLARLYRRAMFSTHVLNDDDREHAVGCIERLADQMGARDA
ncbi:MAG: DUF4129 domain-containing protein [Tessaracoccus sp.]|uniref:DUF4129 domain-containing protein n=1 Tax=Tessaracoccus sp. TaxID=1971211 RepID=UPI001ECFAC2B|nr:DUF4129 domain-containing protein [Tessaracoccus sp.]MBK7820087.1 DUF4129 domain-containing protein [Tessaracoccus sp.]